MIRKITLHLFESYFRHRWLNLLPILIMIIASGIYIRTAKVEYSAQGVLFINNQSLLASLTSQKDSSNYWVTPAQNTANEINDLMKTDSFIRAIIKQTNLESKMVNGPTEVDKVFTEVRKQISVLALGNNQTSIYASSEDPISAYQLVNSLINNYIQWKMNSKKTESQAALDFFSKLITTYKENLESSRSVLKAYISEHPDPVRGDRPFLEQFEMDRLDAQIKFDEDRIMNALDKEENAKLSLQQIESDTRQTYIVIDAPEIPIKTNTSLKKNAITLAVFLLVGVFLSAILIIGSYLLDRTIRFSLDITSQLDLPVLAAIPDIRPRRTFHLPLLPQGISKKASKTKSLNLRSGDIVIQNIDNSSKTEI